MILDDEIRRRASGLVKGDPARLKSLLSVVFEAPCINGLYESIYVNRKAAKIVRQLQQIKDDPRSIHRQLARACLAATPEGLHQLLQTHLALPLLLYQFAARLDPTKTAEQQIGSRTAHAELLNVAANGDAIRQAAQAVIDSIRPKISPGRGGNRRQGGASATNDLIDWLLRVIHDHDPTGKPPGYTVNPTLEKTRTTGPTVEFVRAVLRRHDLPASPETIRNRIREYRKKNQPTPEKH